MKPLYSFAGLVLCVILASAAVRAAEVRVAVDHLNLRAGPGSQEDVVGQVNRGEVLEAGETEGDWLQVAPPDSVSVWVYGELIRDGAAAADQVLVRGGPGINYREVGRLGKGEKVVARGTSASGEWLKIAPPPGCFLWIGRKYVEPAAAKPWKAPAAGHGGQSDGTAPKAEAPAPPGGLAGATPPPPTVGEKPEEEVPAVLRGKVLARREGQGRIAEQAGTLGPAGLVWRKPSSYRLIQTDPKGHILSACYVIGDESELARLRGKALRVRGREYWLEGVAYPVIVAESLVAPE